MRRTFAPTLLLGLAASGLATWIARHDTVAATPASSPESRLPVVAALGLVVLAAWGAVLFTRGRVRRGLTYLLVLASMGLVASAALAHSPWDGDRITATVAAVLAAAAAAAAAVWGRSWPEMGEKYDAPTTPAGGVPDTNLDWWKALDEGADPTADDTP